MRILGIAAFGLLLSSAVGAQTKPSGTTSGGGGGANTRQPSTTLPSDTSLGQGPIFLAGTVVLSDGLPLPERAKIERVCNGSARLETYTDKKGHFSFEVGHSMEMQDASSRGPNDAGSQFGGRSSLGGLTGRTGASVQRELWGCDLQAVLPGFRSDILSLANRRSMDNPDVGTIILHRLGNMDGLTVSVISALAPKDARKAYDKGRDAAFRHNLEEARKQFEKAVELYPKYSEAWFKLGLTQEQLGHAEEARKDYEQAVAAEPKFMQPYQQLSVLALHESKWQELVDGTDQWLRLDPLNSADAYYLSSIGNLQTQHFDVAEKNAREAIRLDPEKKNMRAHYILGLALAQKEEFSTAAGEIHLFLNATPEPRDAEAIRKQLAQIEEAGRGKIQAKQE